MHGQQVFLSARRSLAHLISAIILEPPLSKAAAHATTVFSISNAHSTANWTVQSGDL